MQEKKDKYVVSKIVLFSEKVTFFFFTHSFQILRQEIVAYELSEERKLKKKKKMLKLSCCTFPLTFSFSINNIKEIRVYYRYTVIKI